MSKLPGLTNPRFADIVRTILTILLVLVCASLPFDLSAKSSGTSSGKTVHVRGYVRKDGTYVAPYDRSAPGSASGTAVAGTVGISTVAPAGWVKIQRTTYVPSSTLALPRSLCTSEAQVIEHLSRFRSWHYFGEPEELYQIGRSRLVKGTTDFDEDSGRAILHLAAQQGHNKALECLRNTDFTEVKRGADGRILRSNSARREFMQRTGYPDGRPGFVIDHIIPLYRGGADSPENMQWQTEEEARAKDKWE